jgi:hypothetical protein
MDKNLTPKRKILAAITNRRITNGIMVTRILNTRRKRLPFQTFLMWLTTARTLQQPTLRKTKNSPSSGKDYHNIR